MSERVLKVLRAVFQKKATRKLIAQMIVSTFIHRFSRNKASVRSSCRTWEEFEAVIGKKGVRCDWADIYRQANCTEAEAREALKKYAYGDFIGETDVIGVGYEYENFYDLNSVDDIFGAVEDCLSEVEARLFKVLLEKCNEWRKMRCEYHVVCEDEYTGRRGRKCDYSYFVEGILDNDYAD